MKRNRNSHRGLVAASCSVVASFAIAMFAQGCTGDDHIEVLGVATDSGHIILDAGTPTDAAAASDSAVSISAASTCPSAQTACSGSCATLSRDPQNCGACGVTCGAGEECSAGECTTTCGGDQSLCGGGDAGDAGSPYCASFATDNANCGGCGVHCGAGEMCSSGSCQTTCGASQTVCNGADAGVDAGRGGIPFCATLSTDDENCGACGNVCAAGEACSDGACQLTCGATETACNSGDGGTNETDGGAAYCANFQTDNANCGACGRSCDPGQMCNNGGCGTTCEADLVQCGSSCVDPNSSTMYCGATADCNVDAGTTGHACAPSEACSAGVCYPLGPIFVASFNVQDGPSLNFQDPPPSYSCVAACAHLFGGDASQYGCSTVAGTLNHLAWGTTFGSGEFCKTNEATWPVQPGTPVSDDFTQGDGLYEYDEATGDYPFSAYQQDWCFDNDSINYCWSVPPTAK
ncbi:MAG: hypothetical protein ABI183_22790 [Polyangiaceae bacterium]